MLARAVPRLPTPAALPGGTAYEPKYDGYRLVAFASPGGVVLQSRRGTNLTAAFPEIAEAAEVLGEHVVLDGEVVIYREGRLDFAALQQRLHRAPRTVARLATAEPAHLVCFDLLEHDSAVMISWPYSQRRAALVSLFEAHGLSAPWALTPSTTNVALARQWMREWPAVGVEGIVGKGLSQPYRPGVRGWLKHRASDTAEAVVGGVTGTLARPTSLLLGRYTENRDLLLVARTSPLRTGQQAEVAALLRPGGTGHPWQGVPFSSSWGSTDLLDYRTVEPDTVIEFEGDTAIDHGRWRHSVRMTRVREDLVPDDVPRVEGRTGRKQGRSPAA
ncbi:ATP-dependent DNA ligase [Streptomyces yangpuensis]|uniref:ATP-dependent DNA ligase n=1 Tax=Streptomyces yangpuensis TaxID=1648182 RepID=UPI0038072572